MSDTNVVEETNQLLDKYSPRIARSMLVQSAAQALANAAHNATFVQQQQNIIISANTSFGVGVIQAIGAAQTK
ncbi:RebB family R body protein [Paraneptunicella aestuarii]|uniref:RebB family R body protein n=1 Tax=Paraneptunicella aestuarii TaxID=2831148 RepID=UPI001E2B3EE4|nr:RebB family R body protein [Paraneptunicella aestuarii]UAA37902.1 RebB family R body protein [Paraneptunicella aestuarii]